MIFTKISSNYELMPKFDTKQMVESSPAIKSTTLAYTANFTLDYGGVLNIYDNLTDNDCKIICEAKRLKQIQLATDSIDGQSFQLINTHFLVKNPSITLWIHLSGRSESSDLDFLKHLPNLKSLNIFLSKNEQIDKINEFLELTELAIGGHNVSLKGVEKQAALRNLFVYDKVKDIGIIQKMTWLTSLTFSMLTFKNLDFLTTLINLEELHFMLGGTKNFAALPDIGKIKKLSFMRVRQLAIENLLPINKMKYLEKLSFDTQPHLIDLNWLKNQSINVEIINCKNFKPYF